MKCLCQIVNCELYNFSFEPIDSRMYIIIKNGKALIIDPCIDEEALGLLKDKNVKEVIVLPTHEHYDHISGINWIRENFKCRVLASEQCAKNMQDVRYNASAHFDALFIFATEEVRTKIAEKNVRPYICRADEFFSKYKCFVWQGYKVEIVETPGHSKGSVCILIDDTYVFTGDSLIKGIPTVTRLPGGNRSEFKEVTIPFLKALPQSAFIFPGHGEVGSMQDFHL